MVTTTSFDDTLSKLGIARAGATKNTTTTATPSKGLSEMGPGDFIALLTAQMKNQDPTDPVDASEQMSQLASFSQVEQTIQTNTKLDTLLASSSLTQASSYVGKYMESADGTVKGTIESVKVYSDGIIATTTDGGSILVQAGITVADKAPAADSSDT
jgi:flagellar basal-body rod modification protein FlgD